LNYRVCSIQDVDFGFIAFASILIWLIGTCSRAQLGPLFGKSFIELLPLRKRAGSVRKAVVEIGFETEKVVDFFLILFELWGLDIRRALAYINRGRRGTCIAGFISWGTPRENVKSVFVPMRRGVWL
jgi:hypothetical protein